MFPPIPLHFQPHPRFAALRADLSAVVLTDNGCLWLAADESPSVERLQWDGSKFGRHESFQLTDFFDFPAGSEGEIDIEGLAVGGRYLWLVGSHSRKMRKPKKGLGAAKNVRRLRWSEAQTEPNRYLLGRIPLVEGRLVPSFPDPDNPGREQFPAALRMENDSNALVEALRDDPHIGPYVAAGIPGKANGLDIEGLEVLGNRILLGLRGPVLLDWAILLEIEPKAKERGALTLKKLGSNNRPYRKHFVNLQGLGVRDLCQVGDDLLILAGPTLFLDGPAKVFRLPLANLLDDDLMHKPKLLFEIPCGVGYDHPEGITLATGLADPPGLLVIYDAPQKDRQLDPNGVLADSLH